MAKHISRRAYIQKDETNRFHDIWMELADAETADPKIMIFCEGQEGKENLITLTIPSSLRLIRGIDEVIGSLNPISDGVWEEDANDKVGDC